MKPCHADETAKRLKSDRLLKCGRRRKIGCFDATDDSATPVGNERDRNLIDIESPK
jgi:hypothetical protein